jgi:hypothetical protein
VIFKDRIFAGQERHFEQVQAFYETRIADLQLSYDELNSSLVLAQDRFKESCRRSGSQAASAHRGDRAQDGFADVS